jgi:hypothetical protein
MRLALLPPQLLKGPFTLAQALAAGLTRNSLQSEPWRRIFRGVWVHADVPDTLQMRLAAVRLVLPARAVVWGLTAAWLHGLDVRRESDLDVHVSFPKGQRIRPRLGLIVSQETLSPSDVMDIGGLQVTTPLRTTFDCLRLLRGWDRLVVADAMTRNRLVTIGELRLYFASKRRLRNLRVGEALIDEIEPKSDSPMETRSRLVLIEGGNPRPEAQVHVFAYNGDFIGRADLGYEELKIAIEYDGALHWQQRREDDRRRDAMREAGWIVIVLSADDIYKTPEATAAKVRRARRARAA